MFKLIIFDLDGVLHDSKELHFVCLNEALSEIDERFTISIEDHITKFDGLQTSKKLSLLTKERGLPEELHKNIWFRKQELTSKKLQNIKESERLKTLLQYLSTSGYKIACCSNSIRKTVFTILHKLGIVSYFDLILSNEDVTNGKPHPEIYWKCMSVLSVVPEETLIFEDSPVGLLSASRSMAKIFRVTNISELNLERVKQIIESSSETKKVLYPKWHDEKLNVLIPMAGAGSRFEKVGYTFPKPLIDVKGDPMIKLVYENLNLKANFIFIVQKSHRQKYNLDTLLNLISPNCKIIETDGLTEGAACTTLLAKDHIDNDNPLLIANSDQLIEWDSNEFMYKMYERNVDGGIITFKSTHPKWSFAKVGNDGFVTEVAEKNPISDDATVGIYYWSKGSNYVKYTKEMISENNRVNNEFYVCPVFNQAIKDNKNIIIYPIDKMWSLGTPEDLEIYLKK